MTPASDPYRTLGLPRGASLDEVKRAYRTLAKANHPDAAGPAALPRFLAIQAAYEQLVDSPAGPTVAPGTTPPSSADATRAGATHRAYGGRSRRTRSSSGAAGPSSGATGGAGSGGAAGTSGGARRQGSTGSGSQRGGPRSTGTSGTSGTGASASSGASDSGAPRTRGKATLGSTSYDGADAGPFEPDWGGASWYGTTSGTYWTINPKEYADPRKHGPEYQARARRAARAQAGAGQTGAADEVAGGAAAGPVGDAAAPGPVAGPGVGDTVGGTADRAGPSHTTSSWWESTIGAEPASATGSEAFARPPGGGAPGASGPAARPARATSGAAPGTARPKARRPRAAQPDVDPPPPDLAAAATDLGRALTDERTAQGRWRLVQAVVAWLPIAFGLGWLAGEQTGCGRAAASCDGVDPLLGPALGLFALGVLLMIPRLAALAAAAAIAAIVVAVPAAAILSATGEGAAPEWRSIALGVILVAAWVGGLLLAIVRRLRVVPSTPVRPGGPVS